MWLSKHGAQVEWQRQNRPDVEMRYVQVSALCLVGWLHGKVWGGYRLIYEAKAKTVLLI
jgi:hypothetical protein